MGEGWFSSGRGLGEVHSEMARRGFHYDRTAVAHALIDPGKNGVLNKEAVDFCIYPKAQPSALYVPYPSQDYKEEVYSGVSLTYEVKLLKRHITLI